MLKKLSLISMAIGLIIGAFFLPMHLEDRAQRQKARQTMEAIEAGTAGGAGGRAVTQEEQRQKKRRKLVKKRLLQFSLLFFLFGAWGYLDSTTPNREDDPSE